MMPAVALVLLLISTVIAGRPEAAVDSAPVPSELTYQGYLIDRATHRPVSDGLYTMVFTIYDAAADANALWTQVFTGPLKVSVIDGSFTVYLGGTPNPIMPSLFPGDPCWMGMSVGSDPEMTPRTRFTSAMRAEKLRTGGTTSGDMASTLYKFQNPNPDGRALVAEGQFHVQGDAHVEGTLS